MKKPITLYVIIIIICLIAVGIGVYTQFFAKEKPMQQSGEIPQQEEPTEVVATEEKTFEEMKEEFNKLFDNKYYSDENVDTTNVVKRKKAEDIVFTVFEKKEETDLYNIDINIPFINIKGDVADGFNQITQTVFINKANEILKNTDKSKKAIYSIDYAANLNGDILSVVIKSSIKQGSNPQRIIVQTYNYNIVTQESVELRDVLGLRNITNETVNNKITEMIEQANKSEESLAASGYTVFQRDLGDEMYVISNIKTFFYGQDSSIYVIFAYGNRNFTSEMDIIKF